MTGGPRVAQQIAAEYEARIRADERSKRPSRERVRELVGELLEAEARAGKAVSGELEFSYAHADLREALNTLLDECCGPLREGE